MDDTDAVLVGMIIGMIITGSIIGLAFGGSLNAKTEEASCDFIFVVDETLDQIPPDKEDADALKCKCAE